MWRVLRNNDRTRRQVFVSSRRRCLSSSPRTIVSRRAWQEHLQRHPPPKPPPPKPKPGDKPWPRNLQIAGYAMAALFIPYSMAWFAASNAHVRDTLRHAIPNIDELLRSHFGQEEHASTSYYERQQQGAEPLYQLEGEPTFRERGQQAQVEALNECDVKLRVRVMDDDDDHESSSSMEKVVILPGTSLARSQDILQAIGKKEGTVAIDFGRVVNDEEEQEESTLQDDDNDMVILVLKDDEHPLEHATHTYSMWHYMAPQAQDSSSPRMSSDQLEIAKLEHEIQQLEQDLNDVNCTRDRDDMVRDLKDKRSSLRIQKWKRRLRLS